MAIGATDYLEELLVKKYATEQVDNHDMTPSAVDPNKMMGSMNDFSQMGRNMFILSQKLNATCSAINAANAQYRTIEALEV